MGNKCDNWGNQNGTLERIKITVDRYPGECFMAIIEIWHTPISRKSAVWHALMSIDIVFLWLLKISN